MANNRLLAPLASSPSNNKATEQQLEPEQLDGNSRIHQAVRDCGWDPSNISIQWKAKQIVVTVHNNNKNLVYVSATSTDDDDEALIRDDQMDGDDADGFEENDTTLVQALQKSDEGLLPSTTPSTTKNDMIDITVLAQAINERLDDTVLSTQYEVQVTTPIRDSIRLEGAHMFQAYRGFDVVCTVQKKDDDGGGPAKKPQRLEGKLVERQDDVTILNVKGQMRKLPNAHILQVCLPPAKTEKNMTAGKMKQQKKTKNKRKR